MRDITAAYVLQFKVYTDRKHIVKHQNDSSQAKKQCLWLILDTCDSSFEVPYFWYACVINYAECESWFINQQPQLPAIFKTPSTGFFCNK